jgi:UDP-N-acetylglucosamine 2-epimerase (non-hydrolysing)
MKGAKGDDVSRGESIAYLVGARPNFVKMAPVVAAMRSKAPELAHIVVNTGQHYDPEMSRIFLDELEIGPPDFELEVGSGPHGAQTGRALERIEAVLTELAPLAIVVPGDVNSTLAGALAGVKLGIPVAHLEAGLRSFDRTMPEEINRVLTDQVSTWCFTHSPEAAENLAHEGVESERVFSVGNTMIDTLVKMKEYFERSAILSRLGLEERSYVLVTLHRPGLVDGHDFDRVLTNLARLAEHVPVVFPVHPRTRQRIGTHSVVPGLVLLEPVGYIDFLALEATARAVITDSGGVQEETTFLGVPCFTMRANTERPVTISQGTNRLIGTDPEAVLSILTQLDDPMPPRPRIDGWDGHAALRVAAVLVDALRIPGDMAARAGAVQ